MLDEILLRALLIAYVVARLSDLEENHWLLTYILLVDLIVGINKGVCQIFAALFFYIMVAIDVGAFTPSNTWQQFFFVTATRITYTLYYWHVRFPADTFQDALNWVISIPNSVRNLFQQLRVLLQNLRQNPPNVAAAANPVNVPVAQNNNAHQIVVARRPPNAPPRHDNAPAALRDNQQLPRQPQQPRLNPEDELFGGSWKLLSEADAIEYNSMQVNQRLLQHERLRLHEILGRRR